MDGGVAKCVIEVPQNTVEINRRDSVLLSIWSGGGYIDEISLYSSRISEFSPVMNEKAMVRQLDSLEERREAATTRLASYQQKLSQRYNKDV